MRDSAEWLRNLARNYADGVAGMTPQDHHAWDIAAEIERLRNEVQACHEIMTRWSDANIKLEAVLRKIVAEPMYGTEMREIARAALEGK